MNIGFIELTLAKLISWWLILTFDIAKTFYLSPGILTKVINFVPVLDVPVGTFRSLNKASPHSFRFDICSAWYRPDSFISVYFACIGQNNMFWSVHFRLDSNSEVSWDGGSCRKEEMVVGGEEKGWLTGLSIMDGVISGEAGEEGENTRRKTKKWRKR